MKSAAQRAADVLESLGNLGDQELAKEVRRDDRQRRRMERAIVNYVGDPEVWMPETKEAIVLWNIARRLRKEKK